MLASVLATPVSAKRVNEERRPRSGLLGRLGADELDSKTLGSKAQSHVDIVANILIVGANAPA